MSLNIITNTEVNNNSVEGLVPGDRMSGTSLQNKRIFDQLVRDVVVPKFNALIEALSETTGAGEIGADNGDMQVLEGTTVQALLDEIDNALCALAATVSPTGASRIGAAAPSGLEGTTVQAVLEAIGAYLDALAASQVAADDTGMSVTGETVQALLAALDADKMNNANPSGTGNLSMTGKITAGADGTEDNDLLRKAQIVALLNAILDRYGEESGAGEIGASDVDMSVLTGATVQAMLEAADALLAKTPRTFFGICGDGGNVEERIVGLDESSAARLNRLMDGDVLYVRMASAINAGKKLLNIKISGKTNKINTYTNYNESTSAFSKITDGMWKGGSVVQFVYLASKNCWIMMNATLGAEKYAGPVKLCDDFGNGSDVNGGTAATPRAVHDLKLYVDEEAVEKLDELEAATETMQMAIADLQGTVDALVKKHEKKFTFGYRQYSYVDGMTWAEFCASSCNPTYEWPSEYDYTKKFISDSSVFVYDDGIHDASYIQGPNGQVQSIDTIIADAVYQTMD